MTTLRTAGDREVSGLVLRGILMYVDRAAGPDAVLEVAARSGLGDATEIVEDVSAWYTIAETVRVAAEAARVCGETSIGRRTGEEQVLALCEVGFRDFMLALGTVPKAMEQVLLSGMKMSSGRTFVIVEEGENHLVIESETLTDDGVHPFFCDYVHGIFATIPTLFALTARVIEPECQARGGDRCRFHLSWSKDPRIVDAELDTAASAARWEERLASFEYVQSMASNLLGSHDLEDVLERICDHATRTLEAPRFLLAVRVGATDRLRVHHRGFADDELARAYADRVVAGTTELDGECMLVTQIAAEGRSHGALAVFSIAEAGFSSWEARVMEAYARHAASALDIVSALDGAQRDRDTARALLTLAGELASVGTSDEIADRLVKSVPSVAQSDTAMLWRWDANAQGLCVKAWTDVTGREWTGPTVLDVATFPGILQLVATPQPFLVRVADAPDSLRGLFEELGIDLTSAVPIVARGTLLGILTAGYRRDVPDDDIPQLMAALGGLADHAATALENARLLEDIRHQALHDALTGLPNRPLVEDRANRCLLTAARTEAATALLFLDLDRFKNVNDTLGHRAGDDLIRQVAVRLQGIMRASDTLARLGGDEFVVLLPDVDVELATEIGNRIVATLQDPFMLSGHEVFISCSIGIACAPADGDTYEQLMGHADAAMYQAKAHGRNGVALHSVNATSRRREQLELETALHKAIEADQLRVVYQPQIDVANGRVVGVEALVRWEHPELGLLPPADFLELAEETGLIVDIDAFVRRTALAQLAAWSREGLHLRLALNLSGRDLQDPNLARTVAAEIAVSGVDPSWVELEITDRVAMSEADLTPVLHELKAIGVRLAIDDFGTGTSVLGRLQRCPVDTLKIDRSFVMDITPGSPDELVVKALVALGQSLELEVVAEGVEALEQHELLRQCGCDLAQGYLFSRPVDAPSIATLVTELTLLAEARC